MRKLLSLFIACAAILNVHAENLPKIDFVTPSIVRVQWSPDGTFKSNETGVCIYEPQKVKHSVKSSDGMTIYKSSELIVKVDNVTGSVSFVDRKTGKTLLRENDRMPRTAETVVQEKVTYDESSAHTVKTANGEVMVKDVLRRDTVSTTNRIKCRFTLSADEALYGLGAHMEDFMNLRGKTQYLCQHNLKAMIPVLQSTAGYGLLFDAGCSMIYSDDGRSEMTMQMEAVKEVDYYFMKGQTMDNVVAQYRYLTGGVPMLPRYMTGYAQSRERYRTQEELLGTLKEFRTRNIPIDLIIQDWNYWPQGWGYTKMDRRYYPDPKGMADDVHKMNAHIMISVWPNPQNNPDADEFRNEGLQLANNTYDAFSPKGRDIYWKHINEGFFSQGFDAWWCDSSEPNDADWQVMEKGYGWDSHKQRWEMNTKALTEICGAEHANLFSLYHSRGIYEHQRAASSAKRVVNLTRSTYAGQQRYSGINWNGDTHATWKSFKRQIPAGLNYMATGTPYWTMDAGCFFTASLDQWFISGDYPQGNADPAYREFYTRMLQWATFLPVMRSHGTDTQREPWYFGEPGTTYYDAIVDMIRLRYTLTPYTYSLEAMQTFNDYTMVRMLAFDFPDDRQALDIKDEYLFGRILVCPVTDPGVSSRRVYLPKNGTTDTWIDYWTGKTYSGGQWIEADAPVNRLPLFVRGGSIIPSTEAAESTSAQTGQPIILTVYPGADATFTLYDDAGDGYDYEKGEYCTREIRWNDKSQKLTIGKPKGHYDGMPQTRTFIVRTPAGEYTVNN